MKTSAISRAQALELLKEGGVNDDMIYSICSHGYGLCCDVEPKEVMEKVLFAAGCSRDVIIDGAQRLGWDLELLFEKTIEAMRSCEVSVNAQMAEL